MATQTKRTFEAMESSDRGDKPHFQKGDCGRLNILLTDKEKEVGVGYLGYPVATMYEVVGMEGKDNVRVKRVSDGERTHVIPVEYFNAVSNVQEAPPKRKNMRERSFYLNLGPADIAPSRVQSEDWPYHCQCKFQFHPKLNDDYTRTVFQKEAIERYKEKIADGSIYENANKLLDEWKGTKIRIVPSLCTLDRYGYGNFYTGQVARDTDKKELKLCTLAFFTALIDTVFGDEVQCVCYDHPEILLKDSLKRQINYNLNPHGTVTICFQVPL